MTVAEILAAIPGLSALVVGDVCLDRWCRYEPSFNEPSRETGIPRVAVVEVERTPGAAGTIAANLVALGTGRVSVIGVAGSDGHAHELRQALDERGIDASGLVTDPRGLTFTYTKLINRQSGIEDLPRIDYVNSGDLAPAVEREVVARFEASAPRFDVVLVSDQMELDAGGVVTSALRDALASFAARHPEKIVWVDSRARPERFRGVLVKLNEDEAAAACRRLGIATDYQALRRHIGHGTLILTKGSAGAVVVTESGEQSVPARRVDNVVDICGAGDSFNAGGALALRLTQDPLMAARFGNLVASITVTKRGTGTASPEEVLRAAG
ncbi:MAG: PfkB family carbohydrate kinase [Bryobacteraceae bacterium]|nr:PfkB family carbohydrate kinase [Bryobacteraceae bacterium]